MVTAATRNTLQALASQYLSAAQQLASTHASQSIYLCSYYLELMIKDKICERLGWNEYVPFKSDNLKVFYQHDIGQLLYLSGSINNVLNTAEYNFFKSYLWSDKIRYVLLNRTTVEALEYITNAQLLIQKL